MIYYILHIDSWVRKIPWRRSLQSTSVFLPGEAHGQRRLVSYTIHGVAESDKLKWLSTQDTYLYKINHKMVVTQFVFETIQIFSVKKKKNHSGEEKSLVIVKKKSLVSQRFMWILKNYACVLGRVRFFAAPWSVAHQAPLSVRFSRQE